MSPRWKFESFVLVLLFSGACFCSDVIINELKLWGDPDTHFIELYNTLNDTDIVLNGSYNLVLLDEPLVNKIEPFTVFNIVDLNNQTINAHGYLAINTANVTESLETNVSYALTLHEIGDKDYKIGDKVDMSSVVDAVVFTYDSKLTLLSYHLKVFDNDIEDVNISLSRCEESLTETGLYRQTVITEGEPNKCSETIVTTAPPTTTTPSVTTVNDSSTTQVPTSTDNTTLTPNVSSTIEISTQPTETTSSVTSSPSQPMTTHKPFITTGHNLTVNELNLMIGEKQHIRFIEIHGPRKAKLLNSKVKCINALDDTLLWEDNVTETDEKGLALLELTMEFSTTSLAVIVYDNDNIVDTVIISNNGNILAKVAEKYLPNDQDNIFIISPQRVPVVKDNSLSISRCKIGDEPGDFMITYASPNERNNCTTYYHRKIQLKLIDANCQTFKDNIGLKKEITSEIVRTTGKTCQCGLSSYIVQETSIYCGSVIFEANLKFLTKEQADKYFEDYKKFVENTKMLTIGGIKYHINNTCYDTCYKPPSPTTPDNNDKGSINVTVAVVVTCIVVFILIIIIVIVVLKKKRNGLLQFSMIRLEEDNGLLMDDTKGVRFKEGSAIII